MKPVVTRIAKRTAKGVAKSYVKPIKVPPKGGKAAQGGDAASAQTGATATAAGTT